MQLLTWTDWLASIPYYEAEKQQEHFATQVPPEGMDQEIRSLGFRNQPIFLRNDTHQLWFWGFWSHKEALLAILKLT
jgi:hypothetical protein